MQKNWQRNTWLMAFCVLCTSASYTMLIPFLPLYLLDLGTPEADVPFWSSAVFSITFCIAAIMAPIWGRIADRYGRKKMAVRACIGLTLSYAVGGLVTSRLTDIAGSSAYVMGSIVSYSNEVKEKLVGVQHATLAAHGAVSEETAREMAEGVRRAVGTDVGLATTGIAGPGGGTAEKPVGLVYTAASGPWGTVVRENHFRGTRMEVKRQASEIVLAMVLDALTEK